MGQNMKFYVVSIVAIFAALGIGIFIGFTLDTQSFVLDQKEDITAQIEERFDSLRTENEKLKKDISNMENENENNLEYMDETYKVLSLNKLKGDKVFIIETNDDYMYSGIEEVIKDSNGEFVGKLVFTNKVDDEEIVKNIYKENNLVKEKETYRSDITLKILKALEEKNESLLEKFSSENIIELNYNKDLNFNKVLLAGGSIKENKNRMLDIDKNLIKHFVERNILVVASEKKDVKFSYIDFYKNMKISTVDNVDDIIGKLSLSYILSGVEGHYGIKKSSELVFPSLETVY